MAKSNTYRYNDMSKKLKILVITAFSLITLLSLVGCSTSNEKKTAMGWAKMAVEEEYYQLDNGSGVYLLTHTAVIQTPSLELVEEVEGKTRGDYLYVKNHAGDYYMAFFKHYLVVEDYNYIKEYVYISAIAWEDRNGISRLVNKEFIYEWQIQDLDIEELRYE